MAPPRTQSAPVAAEARTSNDATTDAAQLRREAAGFCLRYACEHCVYLAPETSSCVHEYPNEEHRLQAAGPIVFCKEFELA